MGSEIKARTLVLVPYPQMVRNLFKTMDTQAATLVHAAVGISGEVAELIIARSIENVVEEMGDVHFYLEAAHQTIGRPVGDEAYTDSVVHARNQTLGTVVLALASSAGTLLDLSKKAWIYGGELNASAARYELARIEILLEVLRDVVGVQVGDVLMANQSKLGKRYPGGVYTDRDALTRADKGDEDGGVGADADPG